ncbi:hypothetical protein [Spirosoma aerophilum]
MENPLLVIPTEPENVETASVDVDAGAVDMAAVDAAAVDTVLVDVVAVDAIWVLSADCPGLISGKKANKVSSKLVDKCLMYKMLANKLVGMMQR